MPSDTNADGDYGGDDIFIRDRNSGVTERLTVSGREIPGGLEEPGFCCAVTPSISGDGRFVVFASPNPSLVADDSNGTSDVFLYDTQRVTLTRVSRGKDDEANAHSGDPVISADGNTVAFSSLASNLVPGDTNGDVDFFTYDRGTGITTRISVSSSGQQLRDHGTGWSDSALSADGNSVVFQSMAPNLVRDDTNAAIDVFMHQRTTQTTDRVSIASDSTQANGHSFRQAISGDGTVVAFVSEASNLVADDSNENIDVFVHIFSLKRFR